MLTVSATTSQIICTSSMEKFGIFTPTKNISIEPSRKESKLTVVFGSVFYTPRGQHVNPWCMHLIHIYQTPSVHFHCYFKLETRNWAILVTMSKHRFPPLTFVLSMEKVSSVVPCKNRTTIKKWQAFRESQFAQSVFTVCHLKIWGQIKIIYHKVRYEASFSIHKRYF